MIARPTVSEERWLELAQRYPALRALIEAAGKHGPWKTTTWLARCLGVVLGLIGTGMFLGVLAPFYQVSPWMVGGIIMVVVAEWLVAQRRIIHSGVEEVVYLCGVVIIVAQILWWNRSGGHEEAGVALIAAAMVPVGWRLLNPYITTLAAATFSLAVALSRGSLFGGNWRDHEAGLFCAALAVIALIASAWKWQRPSTDRMLNGLVVVMPWLAYAWLAIWSGSYYTAQSAAAQVFTLYFALGFFVLYVVVGLWRRSHAPLIGALGLLVCTAWALRHFVLWELHWQLIVAGLVLLVIAIVADRLLRARLDGITSRPLEEASGLDLLQVAAAAHLAPRPGDAPPAALEAQGGGFGGGGASGRF